MTASKTLTRVLTCMLGATTFLTFQAVNAAEPDPSVMTFTMPDHINWIKSATGGADNAVLYGDPDKPGFYAVLTKWHSNSMSRPHFHANDRFIYVISGTWWVGWGKKYDPASTYPMPAGSYVRHLGKAIHYDGAKEGEALLLITGEGPAKSTPAEEK